MGTKVKNLNGTSDHNPPQGYESWLEFWEDKTGQTATECGACTNRAKVGAHVQKADSEDHRWFIVPLCYRCNSKLSSEEFMVYEELVPVS